MKTITVGELRQNPTEALREVEAGETYRITRHNREVGRIVPPQSVPGLIPAKRRGKSRVLEIPRMDPKDGSSIDEVLDELKGEW